MKLIQKSKVARVFVIVTTLGVLVANGPIANAVVKKTITFYKGTAVKKVTGTTPKCATGWSTKKPVAKSTAKPAATPSKSTAGVVALGLRQG